MDRSKTSTVQSYCCYVGDGRHEMQRWFWPSVMYLVTTGEPKGCEDFLGWWKTIYTSLQLFYRAIGHYHISTLLWSRDEAPLCSVLLRNPAEGQLLAWGNTHTNIDTNVGTIPKAVETQVPTAGLEKGVRRKQGTPWRRASSGYQRGKTHVAHLLLKGI